MGRVVARDVFMGGFKYKYNDGLIEHFMPFLIGEGFKGDQGSRIVPSFFGGYVAIRFDGRREKAYIGNN